MFAKERQNTIYQMVKTSGAVTTSALMELFQVSIETIRRDLLEMERKGQLSRDFCRSPEGTFFPAYGDHLFF